MGAQGKWRGLAGGRVESRVRHVENNPGSWPHKSACAKEQSRECTSTGLSSLTVSPNLSMVHGAELFNYLLHELMVEEDEENRQT